MTNLKKCSRCYTKFENITDSLGKIQIKDNIKEFLEKTTYKDVCNNCISDLDKMFFLLDKYPFPIKGESLIEKIHYNIENNLFVFTEFYHFSRGSCCKNNCKNCAYGFLLSKKSEVKSEKTI